MGSVGINNSGLPKATEIKTQEQLLQLQKDMNQTGDEAGKADTNPNNKVYVNSGKSFNINKFLNTDGDTIKSVYTDWDKYIDKPWVKKSIQQIDKGMKPLTESVAVTRYIDGDSLGYMTNLSVTNDNFQTFLSKLENGDISKKDFSQVLKSTDYTHKGYTSTTYTQEHGSYGTRDIRLNMVLQKGTPAIVTNNHKEHEILAGRNQKYHFTGNYKVETVKGKKQLVLDVYI